MLDTAVNALLVALATAFVVGLVERFFELGVWRTALAAMLGVAGMLWLDPDPAAGAIIGGLAAAFGALTALQRLAEPPAVLPVRVPRL
jgi:hypothetical protein